VYSPVGHDHSGVYEPVIATGSPGQYLKHDKTWGTPTASAVWGGITGTLSDQTDLNSALAGKAASSHTHAQSDITNLTTDLAGKQATLVSGTNIKTVNSSSILGSGNLVVQGFPLVGNFASTSPADGATGYFGSSFTGGISTSAAVRRIYCPYAGTINVAEVFLYAGSVAGSAENVSVYVRKNNTTDTLIQTVGVSTADRRFANTSLGISVAAGDYVEFKIICPTWATNPTAITGSGYLLLERS
jgi:hypothetical protein